MDFHLCRLLIIFLWKVTDTASAPISAFPVRFRLALNMASAFAAFLAGVYNKFTPRKAATSVKRSVLADVLQVVLALPVFQAQVCRGPSSQE